ncbi:hypothetical protein ES705_13357 [subsurface metagenome]
MLDRLNTLKRIVKEARNIIAWQVDINTALHNIDADWVVSGVFAIARIPNIDWVRISANFPRTITDILSDHNLANHPLAIIPVMDWAHISGLFPRTIADILSDHNLANHPLAIIPVMDWAHISGLFPRTIADILSDHNLAHHVLGTIVPHDALASLTERAHSSLTDVTEAQHHTKYTNAEAVAAVEAAGLILAALKKIVYANDGLAQFGTLDGSPTVRGGRAAHPYMLIVQPKDGNRIGEIMVMPSGTSTYSCYCLYNSSDLENYGYVDLYLQGNTLFITKGIVGGGTAITSLRIAFDTNPTENAVYGLGAASYWWKHIKAVNHSILSVLSGDYPVSGSLVDDITAGEDVVLGDAVYIKDDSKGWKSDADGAATMPVMALAAATIAGNAQGQFLLQGFMYKAAWDWTPGGIVYASVTPGELSQTAPVGSGDQVQVVGVAKTADIIYFNPCLFMKEVT